MSASTSRIDELFGEAGDAPRPRTTTVTVLVGVGVVLMLLGMAVSVVPGLIVVLLAWNMAEKEVDRVNNGFLAEAHRGTVRSLRLAVQLAVGLGVLLCAAQLYLLWIGVYDGLLLAALSLVGEPPPPGPVEGVLQGLETPADAPAPSAPPGSDAPPEHP